MNINQFLHAIRSKDINTTFGSVVAQSKYNERVFMIYNDEALKPSDVVFKEWITGGITGGNCWDNQTHLRESDQEPEFSSLDKILENLYPNITFLQYKKLMKLVKTTEYISSGYYGNYEEYRVEYIILQDLYDSLVEMKVI